MSGKWSCPNHTQVHGPQKAQWPPTATYHAKTPSHKTTRHPDSTMAAYHARTPPYGEHGPHLASHTPSKQHSLLPKPGGRLPCERHLSKGKPPAMHLMAEYRAPPTSEGPLGKFSL